MDNLLGDFYRKDRKLFFVCFLLHFITRFYGSLELCLIGYFLNVPMGISEAVFFAAVIPVVNMVGSLVPGSLGILEGIISSLFLALHWDPAQGFVLQIARRFRAFMWMLFGIGIMMMLKWKRKSVG